MVLVFQPRSPAGRQATSPANASSVPGNKHTAMPRSSEAAKPRVPVPKSRVTSLSPTFADRDRTLWRLKSHICDSFLPGVVVRGCHTPQNPAISTSSKNDADARWTFDGESASRGAFFHRLAHDEGADALQLPFSGRRPSGRSPAP